MSNDTPRTDALHAKCIEIEALCWMAGREYVVMRELARTLERELATLRERLAEAEIPSTLRDAIAAGDGTLHGAIDYWQTRAQQAEAMAEQNAKDAERYQVLRHGTVGLTVADVHDPNEPLLGQFLDSAIDSARNA